MQNFNLLFMTLGASSVDPKGGLLKSLSGGGHRQSSPIFDTFAAAVLL